MTKRLFFVFFCRLVVVLSSVITMAEESNIYAFDEKEQEVQIIAEMTGLDRNQISMLIGPKYGYDKEEVLNMTMDEVDYIITKEMSYGQMEIYYKHIAPRPLKEYRDKFPRGYFLVFTIKTLVIVVYVDIHQMYH